ncbi:MAG: hypothetical protein ACOYIP_06960 [Coriobacteriales bacterium]
MVKVELSYNPYLLETLVSFNGNPPRINSLVEKYSSGKLQEWIDEVPHVFYDEMNGYDFELSFSGTDLDFEELGKSLERAGIGTDLVRPFHKGRIGGRNEKIQEINHLTAWLDENPNKRFDWQSFRDFNKELFEGVYPLVVVGNLPSLGNLQASDGLFESIATSIDFVDSAGELRNTDLGSTPILVVVDRRSSKALPRNLENLLSRSDIRQNQLFFLINYDSEKVERIIRDLGVTEPQIVSAPNDERIARYLEIYPVSERINDVIRAFAEQLKEIGSKLEEENRLSEITNKSVHEKIRNLDDTLNRLKEAADFFTNRDTLDYPAELSAAKATLMYEIGHWRSKKTKIDKIDDARRLSQEYEDIAKRQLEHFRQEVSWVFRSKCSEIERRTDEWYKHAQCDEDFAIDAPAQNPSSEHAIPAIASELMEIKSERYVAPKEDFFESFGKFFVGEPDASPQEAVLETVFYCEKWRSHVECVIAPIANSIVDETYASLCKHLAQLSDIYLEHLDALMRDAQLEKERASAQLSEDERLLQADNDWHSEFRDKLHTIERF